ncbi:MAG: AraC family transcriptional regulator [Pseudomonadales bacterium]
MKEATGVFMTDWNVKSTKHQGKSHDHEVVEAILRLLPCNPSIGAVARSMSISVRTLQRRLAGGPMTFRQLLDRCRRWQAEQELLRGALSVTEISQRLGYSDPAHFVRAFRRWTGVAPTHFRAGVHAGDAGEAIRVRRRAESPLGCR